MLLFLGSVSISAAAHAAAGVAQSAPTRAEAEQLAAAQQGQARIPDRMPAIEGVAADAPTLITFLKADPGLTLHIKRLLIEKAYDMGRLLAEADFKDEDLYRLIEEDENVRTFVTRDLEQRGYITVRPTEREARQIELQKQNDAARAQAMTAEATVEAQERAKARYSGASGAPAAAAVPPAMARGQLADSEVPTAMPSIRPDELPMLLSSGGAGMSRTSMSMSSALDPESSLGASRMQAAMGAGSAGMSGLSQQQALAAQVQNSDDGSAAAQQQAQQQAMLSAAAGGGAAPVMARKPSTSPTIQHRPNPYANVPSLYDMYSQVSAPAGRVERFGAEIFRNGTGNFEQLPMDMPVGPDYVLGPGDGLKVELWGGVSQRLIRTVDREGHIALPEAGTILVAGRSLGAVQRDILNALRTQFRDVNAEVSLARLRTLRVYVEGDVERPGAYDISALSTPLNAVYAAGGPTDRGSFRIIRHFRGKQLVQEVDSYDLLIHGVHGDLLHLEPGDTILVPPVGPEVRVEGMVRRPAIYEIHGEKNLAELLELSGGVMSTGTMRHIEVERTEAHERNVMLNLDVPESNDEASVEKALEDFKVQDGDRIRVAPILPYSYKTVYLDGHVFHPGKFAYRDGMRVSDLVKNAELLPEPYRKHAEVIRLQAPDYEPVVLAFNLDDALNGKVSDGNPLLQPFDTVRVFGRYDFEDPPVIAVGGEVRDPGNHLTNGETHFRDAIYLAGGLTPEASRGDAQVFRTEQDGKMKVLSVNVAKAIAGDAVENVLLEPRDRVIIHRDMKRLDPATVTIQGEIARPGKYPLGDAMTAGDLVRSAGGLKRSAYSESADLSRYLVEDGQKVVAEHQEVPIAKALSGVPDSDVRLRDGDVLTIRQLAGWKDIGASVTISGEVMHPGTYGIREGEKLSSVLMRAGGFRPTAYPAGAILEREQVKELQQRTREELIRRIEAESMNVKGGAASASDQAALAQAAFAQRQQVVASLKAQPPSGRMVIHITGDPSRWSNSPADIELRAGDTLFVPKRPNFVMVSGQVYNPAAITYAPGRNAGWYLHRAGGATDLGNQKNIFIVRADGSVIGSGSGLFHGNVLGTVLQPGDTVVVPDKIIGIPKLQTLLATGQLASSLVVAATVLKSAGL
ncbi:MAG TPA: SLBB domain-containing protein [Terriglobales bacterium]|nr:SLBB domain-containing protein [Terriglobales bacterium]